jgi:predicted GH43/DUF377 family glycosyl hydrolase
MTKIQNWKKRGLIFKPDITKYWQKSHAANPVALKIDDNCYRVFFASRDQDNRSHIDFFDFNSSSLKVKANEKGPVLKPGPLGYFDDHGVYPSSFIRMGDNIFMYYTGWNPGPYPLFYTNIGLCVSTDNGNTFERYQDFPIIQRDAIDPWMTSQPYVLKENELYRMWYISGEGWEKKEGKLLSFYNIKYAQSKDGINWQKEGQVCIPLKDGIKNVARPSVILDEGVYKMWFPYKKEQGYRIGFAQSKNALNWDMDLKSFNLAPTLNSFDSDAMAYPNVLKNKNTLYMFYNGNQFGKDGIGLAIW